jgi:hypothetical protein
MGKYVKYREKGMEKERNKNQTHNNIVDRN